MIGAIKAVLQLSLAFRIVAQSGSPINVTEKEFHLLEEFKSDWCPSPLPSSPAPHWFLNGVLLNDGENNAHHGVVINRNSSNEGHHQSQLTIPKLTSSMNDSTVICKVNLTVILEYHLIIVEPQRVLVTDGSFHSGICVSPLSTSPAPFFTGTLINNNTFEFNDAEANEFFSASITRNATTEGHHQASLIIIIDGANYLLFSNAIITCWVNTDVILQYRLIIESNIDPTTDAEKDTDATTIEISDGDTSRSAISDNDTFVNTLKSPPVPSWIAAPIILAVVMAVIVIGVCALLYILYRKRLICRRSMRNKQGRIESQTSSIQQSLTNGIPPQNQSLEEPHAYGQELATYTTPQVNYHNPNSSSSERKSVAIDTEDRGLLDTTISSNSSFSSR